MRGFHPEEVAEVRPFTPRDYANGAGQNGEDGRPSLSIRATPFRWRDPSAIPPRRWLYGRHFVRSYVTATVSPGGVGKSSLELVEAVAMATGRNLLGQPVKRPLTVWYFNLEDPLDEIERRVAAVCLHYRIDPQELENRLFIDSGRDVGLVIAEKQGERVSIVHKVVAEIENEIRDNGIDVLVIDPFVSSHRVPENDNAAIDIVVKTWAAIADRTDCGVELVHHTRKPGNGQQPDFTIDDARGAGSLIGAVRSARVLNVMSKEDAEKAGVPVEERRLHFRVDDGKANMQPPMDKAVWRKLASVDLGNATPEEPSDRVGVVTAWRMPGALDRVTVEHMHEIRRRAGQRNYRAAIQSPDWIGHLIGEVVGIDTENPAGKRQAKAILQPWLASGALKVERRPDGTRHVREFVVPGDFEEECASP